MNILITGANGFVGNYFVNQYDEKYNISKFSFRTDSFSNLNLDTTDIVIHLSALVHQMGGASKEEYEKVNVTQTLELAQKAIESGVKHFIFMSSVKVYGEETDVAYSEGSACNPQDEYGKSKLKAEIELQKLEDDDFKVSIIRTPIVYGYGVKANIKNLINLVKKVSVLPFGGIENRRSMVYVGNLCYLVDVLVSMTVRLDSRSGSRMTENITGSVFLACDDEPLSTTRLIELIAKELGRKVYLVRIPFFESLLKLVKPSFHKRLYGSLEVDNAKTLEVLFGEGKPSLPFSVEDGVRFMICGEVDPQSS